MKKFQEGFLTNFHGNSLSTVLVLRELFLSSSLDSSMAISTLHRPPHLSSFSQQQRTTRSKPLWVGVPTNRPSSLRVTTPVRFSIGPDQLFLLDADVGYSPASYYTSLGLFVISVPGLWSLIKRSVKSKIVQKTFVRAEGETTTPNQMAGEVLSFFTRNNFSVSDRGETITFEGMMVPSSSQAALLTFCTCISLGSVALVLSIALPEGGNNWFWLMSLSPLAGAYYWTKASRKEEIKVKMMVGDDGALSEIIVRGDDEQVEQMRKELQLSEKGMVYVKGIFEQ